jgi:hypothetical protein
MINNPQVFLENIWNWSYLTGTTDFNAREIPTDLDGCLEKNGNFLILETKSASVKELPTGQRITFESFIQTGVCTVVIIFGKANAPERIDVWTKNEIIRYPKADMTTLRKIVSQWYKYAKMKNRQSKLNLPIRVIE